MSYVTCVSFMMAQMSKHVALKLKHLVVSTVSQVTTNRLVFIMETQLALCDVKFSQFKWYSKSVSYHMV